MGVACLCVKQLAHSVLPACEKLVSRALDDLVGLALVVKQHQHIAVKHRVDEPQRNSGSHREGRVLFKSAEVERQHGHLWDLT